MKRFLGIGILIVLLGAGVWVATHRPMTAPRVSHVHDEPLLFQTQPIGVRLSYDLELPKDGFYVPYPTLAPREGRDYFLRYVHTQITPGGAAPDALPLKFQKGVRYHIVIDLVPTFLIPNQTTTAYCLSNTVSATLEQDLPQTPQTPFSIRVAMTPFGEDRPRFTRGRYRFADFYEGAQKAGSRPCAMDAFGLPRRDFR